MTWKTHLNALNTTHAYIATFIYKLCLATCHCT